MFLPRHPVVENQFCKYTAQTVTGASGFGGVVAYAGSVVFLDENAARQESVVAKMAHGVSADPFGVLLQKVKTGYHQVHPTGWMAPGDMGSSDVIAAPQYNSTGSIIGTVEAPVGVGHLGIWDTVHYTTTMIAGVVGVDDIMKPGQTLFAAADEAKMTNSTSASNGTTDKATGARASSVAVAKVVKGTSQAQCQANINNVTLYPIRVKLLV